MYCFSSKMKLVLIIYQAIMHSCRSQYGYHHQYGDYESPVYRPNVMRRSQRNMPSRFVSVHRQSDQGIEPHNLHSSYPIKNETHPDQDVVVVPYPVPVLIFPISKKHQPKNMERSDDTNVTTQVETTKTTKTPEIKTEKIPVKSEPPILDPVHSKSDSSSESEKSHEEITTQNKTTTENEQRSSEFTEEVSSPKSGSDEKDVKIYEKTDSVKKPPILRQKLRTSHKFIKTFQKRIKTTHNYKTKTEKRHKTFPIKHESNVYRQTILPSSIKSDTRLTHTEVSKTYRPYSIEPNSNFMIYHRDKGPPHLGEGRRPRVTMGEHQGIRLRPTIAHLKVTKQKTTTKKETRRNFKMPKFGLVPITNDLAKELRAQLIPINTNML